jgi:DNA-directed RNA polymerase specialized sigma24 family protein
MKSMKRRKKRTATNRSSLNNSRRTAPYTQSEALNDQILIEEVIAHMDEWTRKVFELRVLGYQFEDIGQMLKMRPNLLRSKFNKEVKKLSHKLFG